MWFVGKLSRSKRGAGSIVGGVFILLILLTGYTFYFLNVNVTEGYNKTLQDMGELDLKRNKENIEFISVAFNNDELNITVKNTGSYQTRLIWLGIFDDNDNAQKYYKIDFGVNPAETVPNIGNETIPTFEGQERVIQLVTELGNTFSYNYPASEEEAAQASVTITGVNGTSVYNPSKGSLLGSTQNVSGSISNLASSDDSYAVFSSYYSGSSTDISNFVDNDASNVDSSDPEDKGTHENFTAQQHIDAFYDTLTEASPTGGSEYGFVWLDSPNEVDLGTTYSSWVENQDLSDDGVPSSATGVILGWINDGTNNRHAVARGAEDTNDYMNGGSTYCRIEAETWRMQIVKLGSNKYVDTWRDNADCRLFVFGYTVGNDPSYRTIPASISPIDDGWQTYTAPSVDVDTDGIILFIMSTRGGDRDVQVRAVGSSNNQPNREWEEYNCGMFVVKIDGSDQFQVDLETSANAEIYLVSETNGSINYKVDYVAVTDPSYGSWEDIDLDDYITVPSGASGAFLWVVDTGGDDKAGLIKNGGTFPTSRFDVGGDQQVILGTGVDSGNIFDAYYEDSTVHMYIEATTIYNSTFNYELDLEVQWTTADYSEDSEYLCINVGTTGDEILEVQVWNETSSDWDSLIPNLNADSWNNVSVSLYLDSLDFTIRFKDSVDKGDIDKDSWNIEATLLHVWTDADEYTAQVEFTGSSNLEDWTILVWKVESCWNISQVNVTIQLYSFTLGTYAPPSGNGYVNYVSGMNDTDELKSETLTSSLTDFRNSTGHWKVKVKGVNTTGQFQMKIDWIEFNLTYSSTGGSLPYDTWQWYTIEAATSDGDPIPYAYVSIYANGTSVIFRNADTKESVLNPGWVRLSADGKYQLEVNSTYGPGEVFVLYVVAGSVVGQKTITQEVQG